MDANDLMNEQIVDVHARALRAAERVGTNGRVEAMLPSASQPWWRKHFKWENLTVAGREVKGIVIHPILLSAILSAILAVGLLLWNNASSQSEKVNKELAWQHDQLVILATQKQEADKAARQEHDDQQLQESADKAWREKMKDQMTELKLVVQNQRPPARRN